MTIRALVRLACLLVLPLLPGGCPLSPTDEAEALAPGVYWVEEDGGATNFYALPDRRLESATLVRTEPDAPEWFDGPASYELDEAGAWTRISTEADQTLDELLQLLDLLPTAD